MPLFSVMEVGHAPVLFFVVEVTHAPVLCD